MLTMTVGIFAFTLENGRSIASAVIKHSTIQVTRTSMRPRAYVFSDPWARSHNLSTHLCRFHNFDSKNQSTMTERCTGIQRWSQLRLISGPISDLSRSRAQLERMFQHAGEAYRDHGFFKATPITLLILNLMSLTNILPRELPHRSWAQAIITFEVCIDLLDILPFCNIRYVCATI